VVAQRPGALERGMHALQQKDYAAAEQALLQAVREEPENARARMLLGILYSGQEKFELAEIPLRRACSLAPREEGCYYLGRLYYVLNRFRESREAFEIALRESPRPGRTHLALAQTLEALGLADQAEN